MSGTNYHIGVIIDAKSAIPAAAQISKTDSALNHFGKTAQAFTTSLSGLNSSYSTVLASFSSGNPVMMAATAAVAAYAVAATQASEALQRASSFDSAKRGLVAVSGSAQIAADKIKELETVAKNTQGLKFRQAVEAQRNLQAAGIASDVATKSISSFANALAIVGGSEAEFDGVLRALTQISSKSAVSAEEINQLAERIPQIRSAMQAVYGTSDTEALQKRGIDPKDFIKQISGELGKLPKAAGSAAGAWENLTDAVDKAYVKIGEPALPTATRILDKMAKLVEENGATWDDWGKKLDRTLKGVEALADGIDYLGKSSVGSLIGYLDDLAYYTNPLTVFLEGLGSIGSEFERLNKAQVQNTKQNSISIADLRKMDDALGGLAKTAKESYDERLTQLDVYYRTEQLKINAGIRTGKAAEIAHQQSLLRVEQSTYNQRLEALQKFYAEKIARAANAQEKERLINEGKTASNNLGLDFAEKRQGIANQISQLGAEIKQQYRADLSDSLQLELDKASTGMQNTLDTLAGKFSVGKISAAEYWKAAQKSLNDYNQELNRVRKEQLILTLQNPALTPQQRDNETEKSIQQYKNAENSLDKTGKQIFGELVGFLASQDTGKSNFFAQLQSDVDDATESLLEFYKIYKQNPALADDPQFAADKQLAEFAKSAKDEYAAYFTDVQTFEEKILLTQQTNAVLGYETKIDFLKKQKIFWKEANNPAEQEKVQNEITLTEQKLIAVRAKNYLEYIKFKKEKLDEYAQKELEVSALLAEAAQDEATARFNLQTTVNELNAAKQGNSLKVVEEESRINRERLLKELNYNRTLLGKEKETALKRVEGEKDAAKLKTDINEAFRLKELGLEAEYQEAMLQLGADYKAKRKAAAKADALHNNPFGATISYGMSDALGLGGLHDAIGDATTEAEASSAAVKSIYQEMGAVVLDVLGSMMSATQQLLETYILTGTVGADAFKQLAASVISTLVVQAGVKAIFETAEGFAAAARYDFVASAGHFTAAKIYGGIALASLGVGLGIGAAGGLNGSGSGQSQQDSPDYYTSDPGNVRQPNINTSPTNSPDRQLHARIEQLSNVIEGLSSMVKTARPGDVLERGIGERKGLMLKTVTNEAKTNASSTKELQKALNLK